MENEGQLVELVGDQSPSPEAPPMSKGGKSQEDVRKGANAHMGWDRKELAYQDH